MPKKDPGITAGANVEIMIDKNIIGQVEVRFPTSDLGLQKLTASPAWGEVCHILEEYQKPNIHLFRQVSQVKSETGCCKKRLKEERNMKADYKDCYLIDKKFCEITQKRIAKAMGMVASVQGSGDEATEILNELANIRSFFDWKGLREYSDKLKDSVDMERFVKPWMPVGHR